MFKIRTLPKNHVYEVRPRKDKRGVDLISDVCWHPARCGTANLTASANAVGYAKIFSRSTFCIVH